MTIVALAMVLVAAMLHATWNLLAKQAGGGRVFVWLFVMISSIFLLPVAVVLVVIEQTYFGIIGVIFVVGTALSHLVYFLILFRAYQTGDLSVVYPLARGLGPALAVAGAVVILGERPSALVILGLVLVVVGVVLLTLPTSGGMVHYPRQAVTYGIMTGVCIAFYTVWDKYAVSELAIPPVFLEAATGAGICLLLTPHALYHWEEVKETWRKHYGAAIAIAVLAPASYILILTAMSFTPLTYVAPAREISILFATLMGTHLLGEGHSTRRLIAAISMVCGVVALAVG